MKRFITLLTAILLLAPFVDAQIVAVQLKDAKVAKRYKKVARETETGFVIVGEIKSGIRLDPNTDQPYWSTGRNELFVGDPRDPSNLPYKVREGEIVSAGKRGVVAIQGTHIDRIKVLMKDQSLYGLYQEYLRRLEQIDELKDLRNAEERESEVWLSVNRRIVLSYERLQGWLRRTGYESAAERMEKDIGRYRKFIEPQASQGREDEAEGEVHFVSVPEQLVELSDEVTGGSADFRILQSEHVRITYLTELPDSYVEELLLLAESVVDGYQAEFVEPYVGTDFEVHMPQGVFKEFWFGPPEDEAYVRFYEDYYGLSWGANKEQRIRPKGCRRRSHRGPKYLDYWRLREDNNLEGIVVHGLGHALANIHFNEDAPSHVPDWLSEGMAYYLSVEFLGYNSVTSRRFREGGYARRGGDADAQVAMLGTRDVYNALALQKGSRIDQLALKGVPDMSAGDFAKCWSVLDFAMNELGKEGQLWLRAAARLGRDRQTFAKYWRAESETLFDVSDGDVFDVIEDRWRTHAEGEQARQDILRKGDR